MMRSITDRPRAMPLAILLLLLLLLIPGCRDKDPYADAPAHPGEPFAHLRRAPSDSLPREIQFLDRMLQHQQTVGRLLRDTDSRQLSGRTGRLVQQAEAQRLRFESELSAARQRYPHGVHASPKAVQVELADEVRALPGAEYEKALVNALLTDYRQEVAEIDTFVPHLSADVKGLAKQIRTQRLHDIRELARP